MGMTMTQKILAAHANLESVWRQDKLIEAKLDMVLGNDITSPVAIKEFEKNGFKQVFDPGRVAMVMDHFAPNKDIKAAQQCKTCRSFAYAHDIKHFYDVGEMGIEHALLPEKGIVAPGECIIGADSHTCTYGALGAFSTGVGSTDMAAGMAIGKCWFKVPEAIRFVLKGKLKPYVSGKECDPAHHRYDRCGRCVVSVHGICGRGRFMPSRSTIVCVSAIWQLRQERKTASLKWMTRPEPM